MSDPRIKELIQYAMDDDVTAVQDKFSDIVLDRIRDIVDSRRAEVAASFVVANPDVQAMANEVETALENDPEAPAVEETDGETT